jgi:hypothetical protein
LLLNALRFPGKESIVTKRVALGELKYEARKEPPYWLTQNAVSPSLRRFAFTPSLFKGLYRFGPGGSDSLSEPVALRVREQTSWFGTHPESNPPKLSQSLFNKRCYLTTRLLSHPGSDAFGKMAGGWSIGLHWDGYRIFHANQPQRIHFGRTQAGSMSHPRKRHGSHLSVTRRSQLGRSFRFLSNRCR